MSLSAHIAINTGGPVEFKRFILRMSQAFQPFRPEKETLLMSLADFDWQYHRLNAPILESIGSNMRDDLGSGLAFVYIDRPLSVFKAAHNVISIDLMTPKMLTDILVDFSWYKDFINEAINAADGRFESLKMTQQR